MSGNARVRDGMILFATPGVDNVKRVHNFVLGDACVVTLYGKV